MKTTIGGVIWDLDGTLADTLRDISASANAALGREGLAARSDEEYRRWVGGGLRQLLEAAGGSSDAATLDRLEAAFFEHYGAHCLDTTRLYPGVAEVVRGAARHGLRQAVLSNKPHTFTQRIVAALTNGAAWVEVSGQRPEVPKKPDPTAALAIARRMELEPERIAFVGDSDVDVETARRAGMRAIVVTWGLRTRAELAKTGADEFVDTADELRVALGLAQGSYS